LRNILVLLSLFILGCSPSWEESPYEVYWIDGAKSLGYSLGEGMFIGRIDEPKSIKSNENYISIYACPEEYCSYYYIDKNKDHKFAEHNEFVYGPYSENQFSVLVSRLGLPSVGSE